MGHAKKKHGSDTRFLDPKLVVPFTLSWFTLIPCTIQWIVFSKITGDSDKLVSWFAQTTPRKNRLFQNRMICFCYFSECCALSGCRLYASLSESPMIYDIFLSFRSAVKYCHPEFIVKTFLPFLICNFFCWPEFSQVLAFSARKGSKSFYLSIYLSIYLSFFLSLSLSLSFFLSFFLSYFILLLIRII